MEAGRTGPFSCFSHRFSPLIRSSAVLRNGVRHLPSRHLRSTNTCLSSRQARPSRTQHFHPCFHRAREEAAGGGGTCHSDLVVLDTQLTDSSYTALPASDLGAKDVWVASLGEDGRHLVCPSRHCLPSTPIVRLFFTPSLFSSFAFVSSSSPPKVRLLTKIALHAAPSLRLHLVKLSSLSSSPRSLRRASPSTRTTPPSPLSTTASAPSQMAYSSASAVTRTNSPSSNLSCSRRSGRSRSTRRPSISSMTVSCERTRTPN